MTENFEKMNEARDQMDEGQKQQVHVDFHTRLVSRFTKMLVAEMPDELMTEAECAKWAEDFAQAANEEAQAFAASFMNNKANKGN